MVSRVGMVVGNAGSDPYTLPRPGGTPISAVHQYVGRGASIIANAYSQALPEGLLGFELPHAVPVVRRVCLHELAALDVDFGQLVVGIRGESLTE